MKTSFLHQLSIFLKRNFLIKIRAPWVLFFELFIPLFFVGIIAVNRLQVEVKHYEEVREPDNISLKPLSQVIPCYYSTGPKPCFIFYKPTSDDNYTDIEQIMNKFKVEAGIYSNYIIGTNDDIEQLRKNNNSMLAAIIFDNANIDHSLPLNSIITIRMNSSLTPSTSLYSTQVGDTNEPTGYSEENSPILKYIKFGFLTIENILSQSFYKLKKPSITSGIDIKFQQLPLSEKDYDPFSNEGTTIGLNLGVVAFVIFSVQVIKFVVQEKEEKTKEVMKIMGLRGSVFWIGWAITYSIVSTYVVFFISLIAYFANIFPHANYYVYFLFMWFYLQAIIALMFFLSTFFSSAKTSASMGWILLFVSWFFNFLINPGTSNFVITLLCFLPPFAMQMGVNAILATSSGITWSNFTGDAQYPFYGAFTMVIIDILLYHVLTWYFEHVFPGEFGLIHPWNFFLKSSYWKSPEEHINDQKIQLTEINDNKVNSTPDEYNPEDYQSVNLPLEDNLIQVTSLRKIFRPGFCKKDAETIAINDFSVRIYKNQITALLGHNGAGKSTFLSCLTGFINFDEGNIFVNNKDLVSNLDYIRSDIGYCGQTDSLFSELTVEEHLQFYGQLRGLMTDQIETEITNLLKEIELTQKRNTKVSLLSGGEKRKLSALMALISMPQIIILDEPSTGVDVKSRHLLWSMLQKRKENHVILFTTHSLDEADLLGDRIAIMSKGKLRCVGSSLFLKFRFGVGYHLTASLDKIDQNSIENLTSFVMNHIPTSKIHKQKGKTIIYLLPLTSVSDFPKFFESLENNREELNIHSFGLELTSLQEIFLQLAEEQTNNDKKNISVHEEISSQNDPVINIDEQKSNIDSSLIRAPRYNPFNWKQQYHAMFRKHFLLAIRDFVVLFFQLGIPLIYLIIILLVINNMNLSDDTKSLTLTNFHLNSELPYTSPPSIRPLAKDFASNLSPLFTPKYFSTHDAMINYSLTQNKPVSYAGINFNDIQYSTGLVDVVVRFNDSAYHSSASMINLITNVVLSEQNTSSSISIINHPFIEESNDRGSSNIISFVTAFAVALSFCYMPAGFGVNIVKEKETKAICLQKAMGLRFYIFWTSSFIIDYCFYLIPTLIALLLFKLFENPLMDSENAGAVSLLFLFYGFSAISFSYFLTMFVEKHGVFIPIGILFNVILSVACFVIYTVSLGYFYEELKTIQYFLCLIPGGCLMIGFFRIFIGRLFSLKSTDFNALDYENSGLPIMMLALTGLFYLFVVMLVDSGITRTIIYRLFATPTHFLENKDVDEDVLREEEHCHENLTDPIVTRELNKTFPKKVAVNKISFSAQQSSCFGLIGANGAGKTTTVLMLVGDLLPSAGDVFINKKEIRTHRQEISDLIGYSPQMDSLFDSLTTREHLALFARIKGINEENIDTLVEETIQSIDLVPHAKKKFKELSGGNKRKLMTAIALIGSPPILLLDEPSTGLDVQTRINVVWKLIKQYIVDRTTILTSHSMEETEELCNRVAIMVNGQIIAIGNSQHLKTKYGKGFNLEIQFNDDCNIEGCKTFLLDQYPDSTITDQFATNLRAILPHIVLSQFFFLMEANKQNFGIQYYSIGQPTLEQVFISLAKITEEEDENVR